jgi:acyl-CoA synthetase (AMP-forming)/AMP-acid ligase II
MAPTLREDIVTLTPDLVHEAVRRFTAADGIFAVTERQVAGSTRRVFAHAAPTVLDILTSGRGHGGTDFLVFGDRRWSFEQFFADVDALAAVLQHDIGVRPGNRIAIAMRNCPDWVLTFAAAVHVGAVPVLINSWGSAEELEFTLRDSNPTVLAADLPRTRLAAEALEQRRTVLLFSDVDGGLEQLDRHSVADLDIRNIEGALATGRERNYAIMHPEPEDMAMLLYTSGSTGKPKGVVLSHRNMVTGAHSVAQYLENQPSDKLFARLTWRPQRAWLKPREHLGIASRLIENDALSRGRMRVISAAQRADTSSQRCSGTPSSRYDRRQSGV